MDKAGNARVEERILDQQFLAICLTEGKCREAPVDFAEFENSSNSWAHRKRTAEPRHRARSPGSGRSRRCWCRESLR